MRVGTALVATLAWLLGPPRVAMSSPGVNSPVAVQTIAHGIRLSLTVPRRHYPLDGLIRATVKVRNDSAQPILAPTISCRADVPLPPWRS